ncbi:feruloyl esterase B-2 [Penicillium longicatenatum]|uniref:feruloyl esterase B-2 n=1 Tax=Penicillium longicatenatum TaxID=1561947 RepID=UPI0025479858|nr:feruloyl esterase B-2 [Penicillium longicatenatum]KAJ5649256.1 feruloyl esterase B-2 [Penicillium longicatenatum]
MFLLLLFLGLITCSAADHFKTACSALHQNINLPNVIVNFAEFVPAKSNVSLIDNPASCGAKYQTLYGGDICRVAMSITTSNQSGLTAEMWLPRDYTGRFLSTGNGGLAGCIKYDDMAYGTMLGFATVGANNGHNGTSGAAFLNNPEVVADFAYRSLHTGVVVGKKITTQFYPEGYRKSYYLGCSTGVDFDGVVAGSPAFNFVNLNSWGLFLNNITGPMGSPTSLTQLQWTAVQKEVIRQCDGIDGALDGLIEDPSLCNPILETLICTPKSNSSTCLTGTQANTVRQVLSPFYGPDGTLYYPQMNPGVEANSFGLYYNGLPPLYPAQWYQDVVLSNPNWDYTTWTLDDAAIAYAQNPFDIETYDANLAEFQNVGGRVLHYHGMQDPLISSESSKLYYRKVAESMNLGPSELDEFYRFFTISGMSHCAPGTGPSYIGQGIGTYVSSHAEDNVLMAMVKWVEEGIAPETVRGSMMKEDKVEYRRRHCRYPKRNIYKGPGGYEDENAWECI